jgi:hypothetical protein
MSELGVKSGKVQIEQCFPVRASKQTQGAYDGWTPRRRHRWAKVELVPLPQKGFALPLPVLNFGQGATGRLQQNSHIEAAIPAVIKIPAAF